MNKKVEHDKRVKNINKVKIRNVSKHNKLKSREIYKSISDISDDIYRYIVNFLENRTNIHIFYLCYNQGYNPEEVGKFKFMNEMKETIIEHAINIPTMLNDVYFTYAKFLSGSKIKNEFLSSLYIYNLAIINASTFRDIIDGIIDELNDLIRDCFGSTIYGSDEDVIVNFEEKDNTSKYNIKDLSIVKLARIEKCDMRNICHIVNEAMVVMRDYFINKYIIDKTTPYINYMVKLFIRDFESSMSIKKKGSKANKHKLKFLDNFFMKWYGISYEDATYIYNNYDNKLLVLEKIINILVNQYKVVDKEYYDKEIKPKIKEYENIKPVVFIDKIIKDNNEIIVMRCSEDWINYRLNTYIDFLRNNGYYEYYGKKKVDEMIENYKNKLFERCNKYRKSVGL